MILSSKFFESVLVFKWPQRPDLNTSTFLSRPILTTYQISGLQGISEGLKVYYVTFLKEEETDNY